MPLIIEGRVPDSWAERVGRRAPIRLSESEREARVSLALINNMPDAALEDTESQFFELLDIASGDNPVFLKLYSLTGIPRTDRGQRRLDSFYYGLDDLWNSHFDAMIVTGTEPRCADLRDEPYWETLTKALDWAEENTVSTVLSCLAAHAGVLHSDRIGRHRLADKQFGVFDFAKTGNHPLTDSPVEKIRFPHSRWNELRADALTACGYTILTQSIEGGVDTFVKKKKQSLFLHFQGHPEYGAQTLLKEYRRDIKRFLKRERETYPSMPQGYFAAPATGLLDDFRKSALLAPREELMDSFPGAAVVGSLQKTWHSSAVGTYRNWLHYLMHQKAELSAFPAMAAVCHQPLRKRTAVR